MSILSLKSVGVSNVCKPLNSKVLCNFLTLLHIMLCILHIHLAIVIKFSALLVHLHSTDDLRTRGQIISLDLSALKTKNNFLDYGTHSML